MRFAGVATLATLATEHGEVRDGRRLSGGPSHFATARKIEQQRDTTVEDLLRSRAERFKAVRFHLGMDWAWMEPLPRWNTRDWFTELLVWRLNMPEPESDLEWEEGFRSLDSP